MPVRIRIMEYKCRKGHRAIASCAINGEKHGRLVEVCSLCYMCGPCYDLIPREEALKHMTIAEIDSPCNGDLMCRRIEKQPNSKSSIIEIGTKCFWIVHSQYTAFLTWDNLAIFAINPLNHNAPPEVQAAATAYRLCGGAL